MEREGDRNGDRNKDRAFGHRKLSTHQNAAVDRDGSWERHRSERWERRIATAKKDHRPQLRDWRRDRFGVEGSRAAAAFEALNWERRQRDGIGGIPREARDDLTPQEFWEQYERRRLPVIVSGIPSEEGWRAREQWSLEQLDRRCDTTQRYNIQLRQRQ